MVASNYRGVTMEHLFSIPQLPRDPLITLYITFDLTLSGGLLASETDLICDAYKVATAKVYGEEFVKIAQIEPDFECGAFKMGKAVTFRASVYCPSFDFCQVLDSEIRTMLANHNIKENQVFTRSQYYNTRNEKSFFSEDWNGYLDEVLV